jgi:hypothetical protein
VGYVFDVILSDFGRDSALKLARDVATTERSLIAGILTREHGRQVDFLDEYRRIMFSIVGDLAYIKRGLLTRKTSPSGLLSRGVLFGVGGTRILAEEISAMVDVLIDPICAARDRGYESVRVIIPCNTLANVEQPLLAGLSFRIPDADCHIAPETSLRSAAGSKGRLRLDIYSLPRVVISHVVSGPAPARLMVLGTELARESYVTAARAMSESGLEVLDISSREQQLMDELLVASIGGDRGEVAAATAALERDVLGPRLRSDGPFVIVQASTDYDVGIGSNSLKLLADQLVLDVYGSSLEDVREEGLTGPTEGIVKALTSSSAQKHLI